MLNVLRENLVTNLSGLKLFFKKMLTINILAFIICFKFGIASSCDTNSFTWVANMHDSNPYFWKSPSFNWNAISTLAVFSSLTDYPDRIEMRDYAQSMGIAVVGAVSPGGIDMTDETARNQWVNDTITYVKSQGMNGINVDYEGNNPSLTEWYNSLVVDLCNGMHDAIPHSQVSVDVPIYPEYEARNYDYKTIAAACDSLFIMAYDGEFWDNVQCAASKVNCSNACASIEEVEFGIQQYLAQGVSPQSLYLGLPWYGIKYMHVMGVPFQMGQIHSEDVLAAVQKAGSSGNVRFDDASSTWIFDCGGLCSQWTDLITDRTDTIWFDNSTSLRPKYALASKYGLKGVGMWEATHVTYDPHMHTEFADEMWNSLCNTST